MADDQNNAPLGANDEPRFEPPSHLREQAREVSQARRFGFGEGVYEEGTGTSWPAEAEDDGEEIDLLVGPYYDRDLTGIRVRALELALQGAHGDAHHEGVITRAEAFHRFLTGKKAAD